MRALALAYRIISGLVVAAFCSVHLASLLEWNLRYPLGDERFEQALGYADSVKLHEWTGKWCRATACEQRWNMFSNVGASSSVPLIVIVHKNMTRTLLHSPVQPELVNPPPDGDFLRVGLADEHREMAWRFNFGNGRIRKLEDNALGGPPGYTSSRMTYLRWRLRAYIDSGGSLADVQRIDLFRFVILHPNPDGPPRHGGATWLMQYDHRGDPLLGRH